MHSPRTKLLAATALTALAATASGALALHAARAAQPPVKRLTFIEHERGAPTADLGKHGFTPLDRQVITSDILDLHGKVVGRIDDDCGVTAVGKRAGAVCSGVYLGAKGQVHALKRTKLGLEFAIDLVR